MTAPDPDDVPPGDQAGGTGPEPTPPTWRADRAQLPADVDAAFAAIVADWASDGAPAWPVDPPTPGAPDGGHPDGPSSGIGTATPPHGRPTAGGPAVGPGTPVPRTPPPSPPPMPPPPPPVPHRPYPEATEPDEHFVPPEPPPLPRLGLSSLVGIGLLIVGVVLLAVPSLLGASIALGIVPGLLAMTAGLGWLVFGMRRSTDRGDDGPDGGAVL